MIEHAQNGYILDDPENIHRLADYVELLRDPQHRESLGKSARKIADSVSMKHHTEQMLTLYKEICSHKRLSEVGS